MSVSGIHSSCYQANYEMQKPGRTAEKGDFLNQLGNVKKSGGTFELHYFENEDGEKAVGAMCGAGYSATVYEPKDFDPTNPVYKVKIWDNEGNVTERMVDISEVSTEQSDYIDMFAYSNYLEKSGKCPGALSAFMGAGIISQGAGSRSYDELFGKENWLDKVKEIMQMQYDAGNMEGYLNYKNFLDFLR